MKHTLKIILLAILAVIVAGGCASTKKKDALFPDPTKWIALTFDNGPSGNTETLLDLMKEYGVKATFFVTGSQLARDEYTPVVQRMIDEGHEIANNAYLTVNLGDEANREPIRDNIRQAQELIKKATGSDTQFFRPPNLNRSNYVDDVVKQMGLVYIGGYSVSDWDYDVGPSLIKERIGKNAKDGQIIILHDFGNNNTIEAFPDVVWELRSKGYGFITVSELIRIKKAKVSPGTWYDRF